MLGAVRFPAIDFFEGFNPCREGRFGDGFLLIMPLGSCLLEMAGIGLGGFCPTSTLDPEEGVFVLKFLVFCPGATVFICCLAGRVGSDFLLACLSLAGDILDLKILDFSSGALVFFCFVAGDPAGNIFEITNCLC